MRGMSPKRMSLAPILSLLVWPALAQAGGPTGRGVTTVIVVRHGQTSYNAARPVEVMQGQADVPLNQTGRAQAHTLAGELNGKSISAVYYSPLKRAKEMARIVADGLGLKHAALHSAPRLKEVAMGKATGLTNGSELARVVKQWFAHPEQPVPSGIPDAKPLEKTSVDPKYVRGIWFRGESLQQMQQRCWKGLCAIAADNPGKTVLVVTHGQVIEQLRAKVQGAQPKGLGKQVRNGSQTVFTFDESGEVRTVSGP